MSKKRKIQLISNSALILCLIIFEIVMYSIYGSELLTNPSTPKTISIGAVIGIVIINLIADLVIEQKYKQK